MSKDQIPKEPNSLLKTVLVINLFRFVPRIYQMNELKTLLLI